MVSLLLRRATTAGSCTVVALWKWHCPSPWQQEAEQVPGLEQYALAAFGKALKWYAHVGGECGLNATRVLPICVSTRPNSPNAG
jgi:hypothetical protein